MLKVENLSFSYVKGTPILNDVSFHIKEKGITTLLGANGCGKSTLLQLLTKNLKPDAGNIQVAGTNLKEINLKQFARLAAIVHQKNTAPDDISVERLVSYGRLPYSSIFKSQLDAENQEQVERALSLTDLTDLRERRIGTLSGGQRQRAFIAMALAQNTKLLFLDEPTTFLDVRYQVDILRLVERLNKEEGITIVMVLHDINQSLHYSDEVLCMKNGKMIAQGEPETIVTSELVKEVYGVELQLEKINGKPFVIPV